MKARPNGPPDISRELWKSKHMEAETSSTHNLEVEKLKPEDIPGAVIENESQIGKWTVDKLKFWLKCRRLNQQGNKKQLLEK